MCAPKLLRCSAPATNTYINVLCNMRLGCAHRRPYSINQNNKYEIHTNYYSILLYALIRDGVNRSEFTEYSFVQFVCACSAPRSIIYCLMNYVWNCVPAFLLPKSKAKLFSLFMDCMEAFSPLNYCPGDRAQHNV